MRLTKWYMDFVGDDGRVCLCYAAQLRYLGVPVGYSALLEGALNEPFHAHYRLKAQMPHWQGEDLRWRAAAFDTEMCWQAADGVTAPPLTLWQGEQGAAVWHNVMPRACAQRRHGNVTAAGMGYAECLNLSLPPWALPIRRLRWGRFVSKTLSLVWIEWRLKDGGIRQWLLRDGGLCEGFDGSDERIVWPGGVLRLSRPQPIRQGAIRDTAFSQAPLLKLLLPERVLNIHESKYLASAVVELQDGRAHHGWVIDETVVFP